MSLKGDVSGMELLDTIENVKKGKKDATQKLLEYVEKGAINTELYNKLMTEYHINKDKKVRESSRKIKSVLAVVILLISLVSVAVIYHNNAIDDAYDEGYIDAYHEGRTKGYEEGYNKGYKYYENIKDEYNFYHKYAVIVTSTGKKYHRYDCYHIENRNFYIYNIANAKAQGYTSCLDCFD